MLTKAKAGVTGMRRMSFAYGREQSLPLVYEMKVEKTKEISVFVDESGSFAPDEESSRFYLICFVLHDQDADITPWVNHLEGWFAESGIDRCHCVHVGPLIRREGVYREMPRERRQAIFRKMVAFIRKADITYHCFLMDKHFATGDTAVHDTLLQSINRFLVGQAELLNSYDSIKVYYDNGQSQVKGVLEEAFSMFSSVVDFIPEVKPDNYRLFQAADLLCSIELVAAKLAVSGMSESERRFFGSERDFKRNILKTIAAKRI